MARSVSTTRMTLRASPSISHSNHVHVICRAASGSPGIALTGLGRARADFPLDDGVARIAQGGDCNRAAAQFGAFAIQEGQRGIAPAEQLESERADRALALRLLRRKRREGPAAPERIGTRARRRHLLAVRHHWLASRNSQRLRADDTALRGHPRYWYSESFPR